MKYIDSEKLIAEIEKRKDVHRKNYEEFKDEQFINDECEDDRILSLITSLQQERPDQTECVWIHKKYNREYRIVSDNARLKNSNGEWVDCVIYAPLYENEFEMFAREKDSFYKEFEKKQNSMKYIPAEKLTKFEETLADIIVSSQGLCTYEACKDMAKREASFLIASIQQERPFPRWIHANYSDKPEIRHFPSGESYLQNGAYMIWLSDLETLPKDGTDLTNPGPEQPEVELEKELDQWRHDHFKGKRDGDYNGEYLERESQLDIARHFYELGLNAKKEE